MRAPDESSLQRILEDKRLYVILIGLVFTSAIITLIPPFSLYIILLVVMLGSVIGYALLTFFVQKRVAILISLVAWGTIFFHMVDMLDVMNALVLYSLAVVLAIYLYR